MAIVAYLTRSATAHRLRHLKLIGVEDSLMKQLLDLNL
jgi:hypothetical protein